MRCTRSGDTAGGNGNSYVGHAITGGDQDILGRTVPASSSHDGPLGDRQGKSDDPQNRSLLVLFYDGTVQGWRIVDASGGDLFRVPIAGSGIFGPETCVVKARRPNENETWIALDRASVERFSQYYRGYRAIAEGVPVGSATLELVDSGCRGM